MRLSEIIPNLDPTAIYSFEVRIEGSSGRAITASMDTASLVIADQNGNQTPATVKAAAVKIITFNMTGAALQAMAVNGKAILSIAVGNAVGFASNSIRIENIKINQYVANSSQQLAIRIGAGYKFGFNGMERDDEIKGSGNSMDFGARIYDPRLGRWLSLDPLQMKFPGYSPYNFVLNSPILFVDPDGREPVKEFVGTSSDFSALLNNSPRKVGRFTGEAAANYLLSLGSTEFKWSQMRPFPTQTGFFNQKKGRYIYTKKGGWLDMSHFMFYAGKAYQYKLDGEDNPVGKALQDGLLQETSDMMVADHSEFSYEDLPSDKYGADFAANYFDPESKKTFAEQLESYLNNVLEAANPEDAPNYDNLPVRADLQSVKISVKEERTCSPYKQCLT